jgi:hypothetical protein
VSFSKPHDEKDTWCPSGKGRPMSLHWDA